ncbi:hypothetical protein Ciccas_010570 [Cichlidogyrus casuarinus]|uniref:ribose-5-phosphate isomerase n=1 Tax=Cichlidogyrus casuarinus TaxID=1844966 RepID=A0ABD2PUK3_9PLAT
MAKKAAALSAFNKWIRDAPHKLIKTIGIGSGSTIIPFVEVLGNFSIEHNLDFKCVPTSYQAQDLIIKNGLSLATLDEYPCLDISFDGADEILESNLSAIKGGGGCLLREKVVNYAAKKFIIICDHTKLSQSFGQNWKKGLPIEVLPLAMRVVSATIESKLGGQVVPRQCLSKMGPAMSDNGNFLLDWLFDPASFENINWQQIDTTLQSIPGLIETGLFLNMACEAHIGSEDGSVKVIQRT